MEPQRVIRYDPAVNQMFVFVPLSVPLEPQPHTHTHISGATQEVGIVMTAKGVHGLEEGERRELEGN